LYRCSKITEALPKEVYFYFMAERF